MAMHTWFECKIRYEKILLENRDGTYGHKKRSTAVLQPLLTLNLIL